MLVKNLHNGDAYITGGALNAWKKYKDKENEDILCVRCKKRFAQHGGHVIKAASVAEKSWYIVPLCLQCNELKDNESFYVTDSDLVKVSDLT